MAMVMAQGTMAYPRMVFESKPNDLPEQAQAFRDEAQLVGAVAGDDRDHFAWRLDDAEADRLWHLELQGDGVSELDVELFWPGEVEQSTSGVATFGTEPATGAGDGTSLLRLAVSDRKSTRLNSSHVRISYA